MHTKWGEECWHLINIKHRKDSYYYTTTINAVAINLTWNQADVNSSPQLNGRLTASIWSMRSESTTPILTDLCSVLNVTQYKSVRQIQD